jgi:hypothetical protein
MRKNPGRSKGRADSREVTKRRGDLNRKSRHKMRTHDGMVSSKHFVRVAGVGLVKR